MKVEKVGRGSAEGGIIRLRLSGCRFRFGFFPFLPFNFALSTFIPPFTFSLYPLSFILIFIP